MTDSIALLAQLRRIAASPLSGGPAPAPEAWLAGGLARGHLHDIYAAQAGDAAAATGFAVAVALAARTVPILWIRTEAVERSAGRLHAAGLIELGLPPAALVLAVVPDAATLLRVAADAARCPGLGAVVAESWGRMPGLDLTATRRLVLAAEASRALVLSLRIDAEPCASAAASRWSVAACPSTALAAEAPGRAAFAVECLRRRGGPAGARWRVEWNRETRCFDPAALSGAGLSVAADRTVARDAPAPVRRAR